MIIYKWNFRSFAQSLIVSLRTTGWKSWRSHRCRGLIGFNCVSGSGVLSSLQGEGGLLSSSGLWGKRKRDKFFVMELSNFSYFYIWFSGTERSEERNLKKTGVWDGSFNQENLDQLNLSKCFLPQASFVLSSNKVMLQKEHGVSHRWSLWQIWDPIPRGTRSSQ